MKEFWKNLKNWQRGVMITGMLAMVVVVVVSIIIIIKSEPNVRIVFQDGENIPAAELRTAREKLAGVIKSNTESYDREVIYEGVARDYEESEAESMNAKGKAVKVTTATFVVDFDEILESYAVTVSWPAVDETPNVMVSCPIYDTKYPETPCVTENNSTYEIVSYLPYEGKTSSGRGYEITDGYSDGELYLEIRVDSCGDVTILDEALVAARTFLESRGFNPDEYKLYVPGDICTSQAIMDTYPYVQANHAKTNDANVNMYLPYFIPDGYNVYPVVDAGGEVKSIYAKIPGCLEYQREPAKEQVMTYLSGYGINYPVEFATCEE